jgi:hypothetical protein
MSSWEGGDEVQWLDPRWAWGSCRKLPVAATEAWARCKTGTDCIARGRCWRCLISFLMMHDFAAVKVGRRERKSDERYGRCPLFQSARAELLIDAFDHAPCR